MTEKPENLIAVIKTGLPSEVREAQKQFEKYWHKICADKSEESKKAVLAMLLDEIRRLDQIKDEKHQAYLINTLRYRLWDGMSEHFDEWRDFVLKYIQHPSGRVRRAVLMACDYIALEFGCIRRTAEGDSDGPGAASAQKSLYRFGFFVRAVEELLRKHRKPGFNRYKYIQSMPPSVYKSLQMLMVQVLMRSEFYREMYDDFLRMMSMEGRA